MRSNPRLLTATLIVFLRRQPGDDNKMLVCDTCDKGYHTFCLRPIMTTIPKNGWKCKVREVTVRAEVRK